MKNRKCGILLLVALVTLLSLTGCTLGSSVESLFTLPQLPEEYRGLSQTLETMLDEGYTYLTPTVGPNIEPVQMVDLDTDGVKEAVALLRRSGDSQPLKVMVFRQNGGSFEKFCTVEHIGESIDSISYQDLTGDGTAELLIGWRGDDNRKSISVHLVDREALSLLETRYDEYAVHDLTGAGMPGLLIISEGFLNQSSAQYYTWETDIFCLNCSCRIDSDAESLSRGSLLGGYLADGTPAMFLTAVKNRTLAATEILTCVDRELINIAPGGEERLYCQLNPQDIDGDGTTEVPYPVQTADITAETKNAVVQWIGFAADGSKYKVAETYHCQSYGWFVTWPEEYWNGITVSNGDIISGENCAEFFLHSKPIAAIYSITCENRESRAEMGDRFIVMRLPDTVFAGEVYDEPFAGGQEIQALRDGFSLIVNTWDTGGKE